MEFWDINHVDDCDYLRAYGQNPISGIHDGRERFDPFNNPDGCPDVGKAPANMDCEYQESDEWVRYSVVSLVFSGPFPTYEEAEDALAALSGPSCGGWEGPCPEED